MAELRDLVKVGDWAGVKQCLSRVYLPNFTLATAEAKDSLLHLHPTAVSEVLGVHNELECVTALATIGDVVDGCKVRITCTHTGVAGPGRNSCSVPRHGVTRVCACS